MTHKNKLEKNDVHLILVLKKVTFLSQDEQPSWIPQPFALLTI